MCAPSQMEKLRQRSKITRPRPQDWSLARAGMTLRSALCLPHPRLSCPPKPWPRAHPRPCAQPMSQGLTEHQSPQWPRPRDPSGQGARPPRPERTGGRVPGPHRWCWRVCHTGGRLGGRSLGGARERLRRFRAVSPRRALPSARPAPHRAPAGAAGTAAAWGGTPGLGTGHPPAGKGPWSELRGLTSQARPWRRHGRKETSPLPAARL